MARRVYVHIGLPKTGTTFLQTTMWHNRGAPAGAAASSTPATTAWTTTTPRRQVRGASRRTDAAARRRVGPAARRARRLGGRRADLATSSSAWPRAEQARAVVAALAPAEVHVVVTVRDYVCQFPAVWQEALKMNSDDVVRRVHGAGVRRQAARRAWSWRSQDVPAVLGSWAKAVPADRIHGRHGAAARGSARPAVGAVVPGASGIDDTRLRPRRELPQRVARARPGRAAACGSSRTSPARSTAVRRGTVGAQVLRPRGARARSAVERFGPRPHHAGRAGRAARRRAKDWIEQQRLPRRRRPRRPRVQPPTPEGAHPDDVTDAEIAGGRRAGHRADDPRRARADR